jgi:hypothetical protein
MSATSGHVYSSPTIEPLAPTLVCAFCAYARLVLATWPTRVAVVEAVLAIFGAASNLYLPVFPTGRFGRLPRAAGAPAAANVGFIMSTV